MSTRSQLSAQLDDANPTHTFPLSTYTPQSAGGLPLRVRVGRPAATLKIVLWSPDVAGSGAGQGPTANWIWDVFGGITPTGGIWLARFGHEGLGASAAQHDFRWATNPYDIKTTSVTPATVGGGVVGSITGSFKASEFPSVLLYHQAQHASDADKLWAVTVSLV